MELPAFDKSIKAIQAKLGLDQLSLRERLILAGAALLILGIIIYQFIISPYLDARAKLHRSIEVKRSELVEIQQLRQEYADLRKEEGGIKTNLAKRTQGFTLFAFIDQQAETAGVKERITYMKPSTISGDGPLNESVVELKLEEVTLEKLVQFIQLTESDENVVSIRRLSIQASTRAEGYLDVILQITTFVEAG